VEFNAITTSLSSRYNLRGTFGTNDIGYWGEYNFISWTLDGASIPDNAVVTFWATIKKPGNSGTSATETVECVMIRRPNDGSGPTPDD